MQQVGVQLVAQDAAQFDRALDQAGKGVQEFAKATERAAKGVDQAFDQTGKSAKKAADQTDQAFQEAGKGAQEFAAKAETSADKVTGAYRDANGRLRDEFGKFIKEADRAGKEAGDGLQNFAKDAERAASSFSSGFSRIVTGALHEVGAALTNFAAEGAQAMVGFVKDSIGLAGDFEAGMNKFGAVVGSSLADAGMDLADFKNLFLELGKSTAFSAAQAQEAAIALAKGGIDPLTIAGDGLTATLNLAAAAQLDLAIAADITAKQLGVWGETGVTATQVADLLAQAANASTVDVDELALGLANVGGAAKASGVSFQDLVTTMGVIAPNFSSAADAGTSLKTLLLNMVPSTKPATEAMLELGIVTADGGNKFFDAQGQFLGMENAAAVLQTSLTGLSDAQRASALETIFGSDAIRTADALARVGAEGMTAFAGEMLGVGAASSQAAAQNQGFNFAMDELKGSVETLQIILGTALLPLLTDFTQNVITPGINALLAFSDGFLNASDKGAFLSEAITGWSESLASFTTTALPAAIEGIATLVGEIGQSILDAAPMIIEQVGAWGMAFAQWAVDAIPPMLEGLGTMLGSALDAIGAALPGIVSAIATWTDAFVSWAIEAAPALLRELGPMVVAVGSWIAERAPAIAAQLGAWAIAFVQWVGPTIGTLLTNLASLGADLLSWIVQYSPTIASTLLQWSIAFYQWILTEAWPAMVTSFGTLAGNLLAWIVAEGPGIAAEILSWSVAMTEWVLTDALPNLLSALGEFASGLLSMIGDMAGDAASAAASVGQAIVDGIANAISSAASAVISAARQLVEDAIAAMWSAADAQSPSREAFAVGETIPQGFVLAIEEGEPAAEEAGTNIIAALITGMEALQPTLNTLGGVISENLLEQLSSAADGARELADEMLDIQADIVEGQNKAVADIERTTIANNRFLQKLDKDGAFGAKDAASAALYAARAEADELAKTDVEAANELFALRSKQIKELAELEAEYNDPETSGQRQAQLRQEIALVQKAQAAERTAFDSAQTRKAAQRTADRTIDEADIVAATGGLSAPRDEVADQLENERRIAATGVDREGNKYQADRRTQAAINVALLQRALENIDATQAYLDKVMQGDTTATLQLQEPARADEYYVEAGPGGYTAVSSIQTGQGGVRFVNGVPEWWTRGLGIPSDVNIGNAIPDRWEQWWGLSGGQPTYIGVKPPTPDGELPYGPPQFGFGYVHNRNGTWAQRELPQYARGVASAPPGLSLVHAGELLMNMRGGERVIPAAQARSMLGGGGQQYTDSRSYTFAPSYGGPAPAQTMDYQLLRLLSA